MATIIRIIGLGAEPVKAPEQIHGWTVRLSTKMIQLGIQESLTIKPINVHLRHIPVVNYGKFLVRFRYNIITTIRMHMYKV